MKFHSKGKLLGELVNGEFIKHVNSSKHYMKVLDTYGISAEVIKNLIGKCSKISIQVTDTGYVWTVTMEVFLKKSFEKSFGGFEPQLFLPKKYWDIYDYNFDVGNRLVQQGEKVEGVAEATQKML